MRLREWQNQFQQHILQPSQYDEVLLDELISCSLNKQGQFDIYSNAYVIRLTEALRSNYPVVHLILGDTDFDTMARIYLRQYPPVHASIRWFGNSLAAFFQHQSPYDQIPTLTEMARFEWALRHTIDAEDAERVTADHLQAIAPAHWGDLQFVLHPSVTLMELHWNTPQIWQALSGNTEPPARTAHTVNWIVFRQPDLASNWRSVSALEQRAFDSLSRGGNFADICETVDRWVADEHQSALHCAELLSTWVHQGLISAVDIAQYYNPGIP